MSVSRTKTAAKRGFHSSTVTSSQLGELRTSAILARGTRGGITHTGEHHLPEESPSDGLEPGFGERAAAPGQAALVPAADRGERHAVARRVDEPAVAEIDARVADLGR